MESQPILLQLSFQDCVKYVNAFENNWRIAMMKLCRAVLLLAIGLLFTLPAPAMPPAMNPVSPTAEASPDMNHANDTQAHHRHRHRHRKHRK
jgi:hypothetical protein